MKHLVLCLAAIATVMSANAQGIEINGVVWAERNVGATVNEDTGIYFSWDEAQTAYPDGWRLPSEKELESLIASNNRYSKFRRTRGRYFGEGDKTIFMPSAGYCLKIGTKWSDKPNAKKNGYYWSSTARDDSKGINLYFDSAYTGVTNGFNRSLGLSVRCVRK